MNMQSRLSTDARWFARNCLALPLLALFLGAPATGQTLLRWKLAAGDNLTLDYRQTQEAEVTLKSGRVGTHIEMSMRLVWAVDRVTDDGQFEILQSVERLQMKTRQGDTAEIVYDSNLEQQTSPEATRIAEAMAPLLKQTVKMTMDPRGEIVQVALPETANGDGEQAGDSEGGDSEGGDSGAGDSGAGGQALWRDAQRQLLGQAGVVFPDEAVSPGATWSRTRQVGSPRGTFRVISDYTFQGDHPDGGQGIQVRSRVVLPESVSPAQYRIRSQKYDGLLRFDAEAGRLLASKVEQGLTTEKTYRETRIVVEANSTLELDVTSR